MASSARSSLSAIVAALSFATVGCIDAPQLTPTDETPRASSTVTSPAGSPDGGASDVSGAHDGMVLVPAVALTGAGSVAPAAHGAGAKDDDKNKDKDKDKDKPHGGGGGGAPGGGGAGGGGGGGAPAGGGGSAPAGGGGEGAPSTTPSTQVSVPAFWIDAREVTVAAYRACVVGGACTTPASATGCTWRDGLDGHPVNCVTLEQARAYCTWYGKRLVRNDEWTAASAGAAGRAYPWGADPPAADRLNACGIECAASGMYGASDGHVETAPVGSFPGGRSPDGVDDLAGNVAEWVDGTLEPVVRGGSYADVDVASVASTTVRVNSAPGPSIGFRCAADP